MSNALEFGKWLSHPAQGEEVVITGISGRFPESNNVQEFEENLFNGKDTVTKDERRWKLGHPEVPERNGKIYSIDKLDAGYFGLHHRQADIMDPLIRKFLECALEAIIDAGVNPSQLEGSRTAVLVGVCASDVEKQTLFDIFQPQRFGITGYLRSFVAHRVSYFLKLKGPSCILDSACSSSLNALEHAYKYIRMGKCDNAIIGGMNLLLHPGITRQFFRVGVLSSDGICKTFDEGANGYVRSEATVCVFLQRGKNANRIYAQVLHSKVNCDGYKSSGISVPSSEIQEVLINDVLKESGVDASEISFMECHGTGTIVGDQKETRSIDSAIARKRSKALLVGSVKSNIGHTEGASGFSSIAKAVLLLKTGFIPPNIHLKIVNKKLPGFQEGRMKVVTELTKLDGEVAIVGISNFGFGGNNGYVILKSFGKIKTNLGLSEDDVPRLVCVSGRTEKAIQVLLDSVIKKSLLDVEYFALLHQIFKEDISGHPYRGYTIVSKKGPIETNFRQATKKSSLRVVFGKFEKGYKVLGEFLTKFSCFKRILKKFTEISVKVNHAFLAAFVVQIGVVEILKLLRIEAEITYLDQIGKLISAYYNREFTLEQAIDEFIKSSNFEKVVDTVEPMEKRYWNYHSEFPSEFLLGGDMIKNSRNISILNISDISIDRSLVFVKDDNVKFLEVLGKLYEQGHNPQIQELYPSVQFPVSRNTPMISPFIQWDYRKSWHTFRFSEFEKTNSIQRKYIVSPSFSEKQKYLSAHIIDGRNLIPAVEYLEIVRKNFLQGLKRTESHDPPIVFENCKFVKAVILMKDQAVDLLVSVQKSSGNFQILVKDSVVVSGKIFVDEQTEEDENDLKICNIGEKQTEFMIQDDIYRELHLRGYNYTGLFKGITKCNVDISAALVKWEHNYATFLDNMLQIKFLQLDTRSLYIPVGIKRLRIDSSKHIQFVEKQLDSLCPVFNNKKTDTIKSGGIEISGFQTMSIQKKKSTTTPLLEKHVFLPNNTEITLEESIRVMIQIIYENSLENNFKAVEILEAISQLLSPLIEKVLEELPLVFADLTVSSKIAVEVGSRINVEDFVLTPKSDLLLIIGTNLFQKRKLLNRALSALSPTGFLLSRERRDFVLEKIEDLEILVEHILDDERLVLWRKVTPMIITEVIEVTSRSYEWLQRLQKLSRKNSQVIIYSQNTEPEGLLGFINCLRREPGGNKFTCFFMMDPAPRFDLNTPFYEIQMRKQMAVNIYKNDKWGTYRHLLLEDVREVEGQHFFLTNTKSDLSSLRWTEGSLTSKTELKNGNILIFPVYSSINFKDIMIASGRVSVDNFTLDRIEQECCHGVEFSGLDVNGRRIFGSAKAAMATMLIADANATMEIPENWSFQDASTVFVVYSTVIYALLKVSRLKHGMSVLIHSATGGIGLAALNVCLYHCCDIYLTVGTQEKRNYLRKNFPQIPESHIGNSRDTSFVEMVKTGTKGCGVDVVLNSLSEEKLKASIHCMAAGGNFLEFGRLDLGINASLELLRLERNINYHGIMIDAIILTESPELIIWIRDKIYEGIRLGYVKPLPRTIFKRDEVVQAYKFMTTGKHIGKVVVQIRDEDRKRETLFRENPRFTCNPEKSYIIVGGLGGFGLELADWLYLRGAKCIILVSRFGLQTGYQKKRIMNWRSYGVTVQISTADITAKKGCLNLINETNKLAPIDGIFNLAVVLNDALFEDQNEESFAASLAPKAQATIYLDQITRTFCPTLRYFVVFSSVSCGRGNAGQTNYGMANSIMERICERRKNDGFPGLAIQWGAIGDVGLAAKMQKENKELVVGGTLQQRISSCLEILDKLLKQENPIVASMVVAEKNSKTSSESAVAVVAYVLGIKDLKTISLEKNLAELGMDSMMGTEMIQILEKDFDIYLTAKELRRLTFTKLMKLECQTTIEKKISSKVISIPWRSDKPILKLPSQVKEKEAKTVFLLPGIDGIFDDLESVTRNLKAHVLGIQYDNEEKSLEDLAKVILSNIEETISAQETFHIVGYSFGSCIAVELAKLLEARGFTGFVIIIDGSPAYTGAIARQAVPRNDENEFQTIVFLKILSLFLPAEHLLNEKDKFSECKTFDQHFQKAKSVMLPELAEEEDLLKRAMMGVYRRYKSMIDYKSDGVKIKSPVHLFKASVPWISDIAEDYQLSEVCEQPVKFTVFNGDHSTILNQHEQLTNNINKLFKL